MNRAVAIYLAVVARACVVFAIFCQLTGGGAR